MSLLVLLSACGRIGYDVLGSSEQGSDPADPGVLSDVGFGDGHWGEAEITTNTTLVNTYFALQSDASAGQTFLEAQSLDLSFLRPGDLLMLWQTSQGDNATRSAESEALSFGTEPASAGRWELVRVRAARGNRIDLGTKLKASYPAAFSQVIVVPEYTRLTLRGQAIAAAWDGRVGGLLALLASEALVLEGELSVKGAGFRGGAYVIDPSQRSACTAIDESSPFGGRIGEGAATALYGLGASGRGNLMQGGGGGLCNASGGGGGGHAAQGGQGGRSTTAEVARSEAPEGEPWSTKRTNS